MDKALDLEIRRRARYICEYCQMPQAFYGTRHQIDHIIAKLHHGETVAENLALACFPCNNHKGPNIASIDLVSGAMVSLYHPRRDRWEDHFEWQGSLLVGRTAVGRATVHVLAINHADYVTVRDALIAEGVFPPRE